MGNRLHEFTVISLGSFCEPYLYTVLEEALDGKRYILSRYGDAVRETDLTGNEDFFISEIESTGIAKIDNRAYDYLLEDGGDWIVHIRYDDKEIVTHGMCYTPDEVYELLRLVGINKRREKGGKGYHFMDDAERIFWICFPKHINRYRQNDVYSNWDNRHWKFSVNDAGNIRFTFIDGPVSNPPLWDRNEVTKTKRAKKREQRYMRRWGKPYRCAKKSSNKIG